MDANGAPVRIFVTSGTVHDCKQAGALIDKISAGWLLADRGYDSNTIIDKAVSQNMKVVIPPRKNCKEQREYDEYLYTLRHLVENAFLFSSAGEESPLAMRKTHLFHCRGANPLYRHMGKSTRLTIVDTI